MNCKSEFAIKRDHNGEPDVRYYVDSAHRMRAEAMHELMKQAGHWVREQVQQLLHSLHLDGHHPTAHH